MDRFNLNSAILFAFCVLAVIIQQSDQMIQFFGLVTAMSLIWLVLLAPMALFGRGRRQVELARVGPGTQEFAWFFE